MVFSQRRLKNAVLSLLQTKDPETVLGELLQFPPDKLLNPLFSGVCHADEKTKWNAVTAMGATVARLADQDLEAARIVMRRFMWSLNDESGGIGWGIPEAMAECLAQQNVLAEEYTHILVSFMREDGFYLEHLPLQQGLMWAVGRLALVRPDLLREKNAVQYLLPYLESQDVVVRALAARAAGFLKVPQAVQKIELLRNDATEIRLFSNHTVQSLTADSLARKALKDIIGVSS